MGYENYRQAASEARYLEGREILIIEQAATIAQQRADIEALVRFALAEWRDHEICVPDYLSKECAEASAEFMASREAIQAIIERYRDE
jgi:hypothetical protein